MATAKTVSLRKFNMQVKQSEQLSDELAVAKVKLSQLRKKNKILNIEMLSLEENYLMENEVKDARIADLERIERELRWKLEAKDKNIEATIEDLRIVVDQQKRELERMRLPSHGKSLIKSSSQGVVDATHANYTIVIPGGKAGA